MNAKETYMVILILGGVFLLQIWVAAAESRKIDKKKVTDLNQLVLQTMDKIIHDDTLRESVRLKQREKAYDEQRINSESSDDTKDESEFVWYKPWTWFK